MSRLKRWAISIKIALIEIVDYYFGECDYEGCILRCKERNDD